MAFQDKTLTCRDCGNQFTWTASEQEFYKQKGFENEPVRCPSCRAQKKARMNGTGASRQSFEITCADCGNGLKRTLFPSSLEAIDQFIAEIALVNTKLRNLQKNFFEVIQ